jgi:hypothetical protein
MSQIIIYQEISAEREKSINSLLQLCLRHKQTKLRSMPIWNPVSELQLSARIYRPSFHENKPKTIVFTQ